MGRTIEADSIYQTTSFQLVQGDGIALRIRTRSDPSRGDRGIQKDLSFPAHPVANTRSQALLASARAAAPCAAAPSHRGRSG